jgi:hypothetical protein
LQVVRAIRTQPDNPLPRGKTEPSRSKSRIILEIMYRSKCYA